MFDMIHLIIIVCSQVTVCCMKIDSMIIMYYAKAGNDGPRQSRFVTLGRRLVIYER